MFESEAKCEVIDKNNTHATNFKIFRKTVLHLAPFWLKKSFGTRKWPITSTFASSVGQKRCVKTLVKNHLFVKKSLYTTTLWIWFISDLLKTINPKRLQRILQLIIQHPSQNQHSCLMMDNDDAWMYYHDEVVEQIDLNSMLNATESICSALGFKLDISWEAYCQILSWISIYLPWSQRFFLIFLRERDQQQAAKRRQRVA